MEAPVSTLDVFGDVPVRIVDAGLSDLLAYREFDILAAYELFVHPDADREFGDFVTRDRSTAFDVGNLFRILEAIINDGLAIWLEMGLERVSTDTGCSLYAFTGYKLTMFLAVHGRALLLIYLSMLGSESERAARMRAITRMKEHFGI